MALKLVRPTVPADLFAVDRLLVEIAASGDPDSLDLFCQFARGTVMTYRGERVTEQRVRQIVAVLQVWHRPT